MKILLILRGTSNSGKSTFTKFLTEQVCSSSSHEADDFMIKDGVYNFRPELLGFCHNSCKEAVEADMQKGFRLIICSNTNTTEREINPYIELAQKYNYQVVSLVVEKRFEGGDNGHNVPSHVLERQQNNIKSSLKLL